MSRYHQKCGFLILADGTCINCHEQVDDKQPPAAATVAEPISLPNYELISLRTIVVMMRAELERYAAAECGACQWSSIPCPHAGPQVEQRFGRASKYLAARLPLLESAAAALTRILVNQPLGHGITEALENKCTCRWCISWRTVEALRMNALEAPHV